MTVINPEDAIKRVAELAIEGLLTDGAHHKQWYLEQIIETVGYDVDEVESEFQHERGIAP